MNQESNNQPNRILTLPEAMVALREGMQAQTDRLRGIRQVAFEAYKEVGDTSQDDRHYDPSETKPPSFYETLQGALGALTHEIDQFQLLVEHFVAA